MYRTTAIKLSRHLAAALAIFFGLTTLGGFALGLGQRQGDMLALACLSAGIALSSALWWKWSTETVLFKSLNPLILITVTATAGLALYSNLAYGVWALGFPLSIGTVANGRMGEHYWLGPVTLAYAAIAYGYMKRYIPGPHS